jgi:hypothetical protein
VTSSPLFTSGNRQSEIFGKELAGPSTMQMTKARLKGHSTYTTGVALKRTNHVVVVHAEDGT